MTQEAPQSRNEKLIDEFVESLSEMEELDKDVVTLIQTLHEHGRLDSKNLLQGLATQREEGEHAEASQAP